MQCLYHVKILPLLSFKLRNEVQWHKHSPGDKKMNEKVCPDQYLEIMSKRGGGGGSCLTYELVAVGAQGLLHKFE